MSEEFNAINFGPATDPKTSCLPSLCFILLFWSLSSIFYTYRYVAIADEGVQI